MAILDEERIKNSFEKVREDMNFLKKELETVKNWLNRQEEEKNVLNDQIKNILDSINKIKDKIHFFYKISSGNNGVINDEQQLTTINNNYQQPTIINNNHTTTINDLKDDFEDLFKTLTDREFTIFMAIYQLEEDLRGTVSYSNIAKVLKITETNVRIHVNSMTNKGIPIEKNRLFNRKVSLSVKKELRDLNLATKLIKLRQTGSPSQRTLF